MSTGLVLQYCVIGAVVAASCGVMVRKLAPAWSARGIERVAAHLVEPQRAAWARWLGRRLSRSAGAAQGCGSGCSTCGGCGTAADATAEEAPLTFQPRAGRDSN
ncbi:DUF6587 family protein [Burkholderia sp. 22PA0106]|uniref:DUF6587 family protein n=1 Tax=Burkholderia sp. 22PA0106 TaxID=3237371 RepID=UPI0039C2D565